jgi:hypothetical protein
MDLGDAGARDALNEKLGRALFEGRRVVHGPRVLAGAVRGLELTQAYGAHGSLVVATVRGAGPVPPDDAADVVWMPASTFGSITEELRAENARIRDLPAEVRAVIDAFDPDGEALWWSSPFITNDTPVLGRPVVGGWAAAWLALEDKIAAEDVWHAAGVDHVVSRVVPVDPAALAAACDDLDRGDGVVWAGDNRDGFNGGGNFVRWVTDEDERAAAYAFFAVRCDRVRVQPFLEGVPCSIHGFVLPDGTAAFRPVEIAMLRRDPHTFVYGGLSSYWDPPEADRVHMRAIAARTGEHLRERVGYRGFFGIDGVLTSDGFLPTELNTRMSAGMTTLADGLGTSGFTLAQLLQLHASTGRNLDLAVADLETLVPAMDDSRGGKVTAVWQGTYDESTLPDGSDSFPVAYADGRFSPAEAGDPFDLGATASGLFGRLRQCLSLRPGDRMAPLNAALMGFLDERYGTAFGAVTPAPDVRG